SLCPFSSRTSANWAMYASTSARRASASIRRAPSRTSSSITDATADRAAPEPSRSAESETTVSIGSYLPDQRLPRRSSLEPSIGHPGRYAPSQADPQISSIAPVDTGSAQSMYVPAAIALEKLYELADIEILALTG